MNIRHSMIAMCAIALSAIISVRVAAAMNSAVGAQLGASGSGPIVVSTMPYAPGPPGVIYTVLVGDGDSEFGNYNDPQDGGSTAPLQSTIETVGQLLGSTVQMHNIATGGITCTRVLVRAPTFADNLIIHGKTNVYLFECGVNDAVGGATTAQIAALVQQIGDARHAAGFYPVIYMGPKSNAYQDPLSSRYTGVSFATLGAMTQALVPAHLDVYIDLSTADRVVGVFDGGVISGVCDLPGSSNPSTAESNYGNECLTLDGIIHTTPNSDAHNAFKLANTVLPFLGTH